MDSQTGAGVSLKQTIEDESGVVDERHDVAMADARRRWRVKLATVPVGIGIIAGGTWLVGDFDLATFGIAVAILASGLLHLLNGPKAQVRSEITGSVIDVLGKKSSVEGLLMADLPSAERIVHLRSVADVLEDPDTFFGRRAEKMGPIVVGLGVFFWSALGVIGLVIESWPSVAVCFALALVFLVGGVVGIKKGGYRYEVLRTVREELEQLENRGPLEQVGGASG